jgi:hypothetical protein
MHPPSAAQESRRRDVYRAALQQFEELFESAAAAGPASRPLPLFYALSQAGRAIAAAYDQTVDWDFHGHGLKLSHDEGGTDFLQRLVSGRGSGAFPAVQEATDSPPLNEPVAVGALWSSLPDLADTPLPSVEWPRALFFWQSEHYTARPVLPRPITAIKGALTMGSWQDENAFREVLAAYPSAQGVALDSPQGIQPITVETPRGFGLCVSWSGYDDAGVLVRTIDDVAPQYRFQGERWLRPELGSSSGSLSPLMTWWALLYALSIFARYEPASWVAALDVNESPIAVHLADALDIALDAVPHLVLDVLRGQTYLAWRPRPFSEA